MILATSWFFPDTIGTNPFKCWNVEDGSFGYYN